MRFLVQTVVPFVRESATISPLTVLVNTGSLANVIRPGGICGSIVAQNCLPVVTMNSSGMLRAATIHAVESEASQDR